ncbi:hypothetical protein ACFVRU_42240, partial [Streptomyces sp. NPDC057927]
DRDKYKSNDIINVKFKSKVKKAEDMYEINERKLSYVKQEKHKLKLEKFKDSLSNHFRNSNDPWGAVSVEDLRKDMYMNGFTINYYNPRTENTKSVDYVVYKRSSAKSRTGQCLFIKKSLYNKMIKWSRMNLPFKKGQVVDLASLLAYESLVGSSLEDTVHIDPDRILIVDDVESKFKRVCNVVRKSEDTGYLDSFKEETEVVNSLFDGESLLEPKYFKHGNAMILLRNHMFKSASFNCEIQKFLRDNCPKDILYEGWKIPNMYGEEMYAKDIDMICTPSSLKALKFSNVLPTGTEKEMWNYWKARVREDNNLFGVCKHEKRSKIGEDSEGNMLQQTSYQMINCLPVNQKDIEELTSTEREYIEKLKNDNDFLMNEILENRDMTNSNDVIYNLYHYNKKLINTKLLKTFKRKFVAKKVAHAKKGKIKILGDYSVLLGNPMELLNHSIGNFDVNTTTPELVDNEVYCTLYENNREMIGFRNPNTSPSNVLIMKNKYPTQINEYLNLTQNIIVVNAINFPIQDILSGCDYDSDTMLVSGEEKLVEVGKRCFGKYDVCINKITGQKKKYKLTNHDVFEIDNQLSHSQRNIGKVVNLGQFCMSVYWDLINNGVSSNDVEDLLKKVDVMTVLSGIAIDMAKKFYDIDMDSEINNVAKNNQLTNRKKKPNFWVSVSQSSSIKNRVNHYDCPMDYLISHLESLDEIEKKRSIHFDHFLLPMNTLDVNPKQLLRLKELLQEYDMKVKNVNGKYNDWELIHREIEDLSIEYSNKLKNWKIKEQTISMIIRQTYNDGDALILKLLSLLYESHPEKLLSVIKKP